MTVPQQFLRKSLPSSFIVLYFLIILCLWNHAHSHGLMTYPRPRGALNVAYQYKVGTIDSNAPIDYCSHCLRGGGKKKVLSASGGYWKPYEPLKRGYRWTTGVCGDPLYGRQEHKQGGKYYYDGKTVASFQPGQVVDFEMDVVTHHNGYVEFYICNLDSCGTKDIEAKCFRNGHCKKLERAWVPKCQGGYDRMCGPIDPKYPGRYYLPCDYGRGEFLVGGKRSGRMKYKIPNIRCKRCVIQFYWMTGNFCNDRGYTEYFEGPHGPKWPKCRGQGNSRGGYNKLHGPCKGRKNPEEYWSCADVSVGHKGSISSSKSFARSLTVSKPRPRRRRITRGRRPRRRPRRRSRRRTRGRRRRRIRVRRRRRRCRGRCRRRRW